MDDKIIIKSRQKWWVYPVIIAAVLLLLFLLNEPLSRGTGAAIGMFITIITFGVATLLSIRCAKVYNDRIEVKYLFHRKWNYRIMLKDVDCCCTESVEEEVDMGRGANVNILYNRIYLLTGKKLWLYVSHSDGTNYDDMLSVLTEYFGIPLRKGSINLSAQELKTVKRGGYILLDDVTDEELAEMKMQRMRRRQPREDFKIPRSRKWKYFCMEFSSILLVVITAATIMSGRYILHTVKEKNTVALSCIDAKTEIPTESYYIVDSVDVDSNGIFFSIYTRSFDKLSHWIYPVKGRNDVWVYVDIEDRTNILSSVDYSLKHGNYESQYSIRELHKRRTYKPVSDEHEYRKIAETIVKARNVEIKNTQLIILCTEKPIKTRRAIYFEALNGKDNYTRRDKKAAFEQKQRVFHLMEQAAEEVAAAQYELGIMYESGYGTTANTAKALHMYELAAGQDYDTKTKIDAMNQMSYTYARRHQYEKAIAIIDSAIAVLPMEANLYDSKGEHLYRSGDKEGAEKMWKRVIELDPQFNKSHSSDLYRLLYEK